MGCYWTCFNGFNLKERSVRRMEYHFLVYWKLAKGLRHLQTVVQLLSHRCQPCSLPMHLTYKMETFKFDWQAKIYLILNLHLQKITARHFKQTDYLFDFLYIPSRHHSKFLFNRNKPILKFWFSLNLNSL